MKPHKADYSDVSDDYSDSEQPKPTCTTETSAVKLADNNISTDDWPIIDLEDATLYHKDGTIANLLNAELQGPFQLRGRIEVNPADLNILRKKKYNGRYIEVTNCYVFSIGWRPTALWAGGQGGWYKIVPSPAYYDMFKTMTEAIKMYYYVTELYEECLKRKKALTDMEGLFYRYALEDGTGLLQKGTPFEAVPDRFKVHAEFLLGQIGRSKVISSGRSKVSWFNTPFYEWLSNEVPEIQQRYMDRSNLPTAIPKLPDTISKEGSLEVPEIERKIKRKLDLPVHIQSPPSSGASAKPRARIQRSQSSSSDEPTQPSKPAVYGLDQSQETSEFDETPGEAQLITMGAKTMRWAPYKKDQRPDQIRTIFRVLEEGLSSGRHPRQRQTISKLGTRLYFDYSIGLPQMASEIIRSNAKAILYGLDDKWKGTTFYKELQAEVNNPRVLADENEKRLQQIVPEFKVIKRKSKGERKIDALPIKRQRKSKNNSTPPLLTPLSQTLSLTTGRGSGKIPGLRPPHSSKRKLPPSPQKSLLELSPSEETELINSTALSSILPPEPEAPTTNGLQSRKRRRAFSPSQPERTPPPANRPRPDLTAYNGEPELSSPSPSPEPETNLSNGHGLDGVAETKASSKTILAITTSTHTIPSIENHLTGPRKTFHCSQKGCKFSLDSTTSASTSNTEEEILKIKEQIRAHWRQHADEIEQVRKEIEREVEIRRKAEGMSSKKVEEKGMVGRFRTGYLMERIRGLGRGVREREEELRGLIGTGEGGESGMGLVGFGVRVKGLGRGGG